MTDQSKASWMRFLGYLLITLIPVTYNHLNVVVSMGEVIDSILSSLAFAGCFALGAALCEAVRGKHAATLRSSFITGLVAGVLMWTALIIFWSIATPSNPQGTESWLFAVHLSVACLSGIMSVQPWKKTITPARV